MKSLIADIVLNAVSKILPPGADFPEIIIEIPKNLEHGDFSSTAALALSKLLSKPPYLIAQSIIEKIKENKKFSSLFKEITPAKNGFINFTLSHEYLQKNVQEIIKKDSEYGKSAIGAGKKVLIEFVSANPTGPLHVGHGRWAVIGDDIANLLEFCGYKAEKEFYVNDMGNQIKKLEESVKAEILKLPPPEDGYGGEYIKETARKLENKIEDPNFNKSLLSIILEEQQTDLKKLRVIFDNYFYESKLHEDGRVEEAIAQLNVGGHTIREEGALWFKSEALGDDKNRVLVKETGETTYFASDIAYHINKFNRGFDVIINVWGADHHGYVPRLKAALSALDLPVGRFEVIIGQLVSLYRGKELVRMSKRTGEMVTLDEVISEIGCDAARFFLTMISPNQHLDFDLELAKKKAQDNPVYYVQYAHARICSILRKAGETDKNADLKTLDHPAERELMRKLLDLEDEVIFAAHKRESYRMVAYLRELAAIFHNFYHQCRVLDNPARILLIDATRIVIRNVLKLLKIEAPERM